MSYVPLKSGFRRATHLQYIDTLRYREPPDLVETEGSLDDLSLEDWLNKDLRRAANEHDANDDPRAKSDILSVAPCSGMRLLVAQRCGFCVQPRVIEEHGLLPVEKFAYRKISRRFGFPAIWEQQIYQPTPPGRVLKNLCRTPDGALVTCFFITIGFPFNTFTLLLSYNPSTSLTHGLLTTTCHRESEPGTRLVEPCFKAITRLCKEIQGHCDQPLLVAIFGLEDVTNVTVSNIHHAYFNLDRVEITMGQDGYKNLPRSDPLGVDFLQVTKDLSTASRFVIFERLRLGNIQLATREILDFAKVIEKNKLRKGMQGISDSTQTAKYTEGFEIMEERIDNMVRTCQLLTLEVECLASRSQNQTNLVYQFMQLKESRTNTELAQASTAIAKASKEDSAVMKTIAVESKKDSTAMKTIAILGMAFLPGTFVAAIFAMPVYNWEAQDGKVLNAGFKYFWAAAVPLTVLVFVFWVLIMKLPWRLWLKRIEPRRRWIKRERDMEGSVPTSRTSSFTSSVSHSIREE